ncbi:hypothetical protein [Sorangium sp. So ce131]|uniref:hypothetical protein n=1 Tax=Sorangium sp. So ce131 TaxID=3133282 RepID=UPI003F5F5BA7
MKRFLSSAALAALLLPASARAEAPECTPSNEPELRAEVQRLASGLRIAQYRADMALLEDSFEDLEALVGPEGSCSDAMVTRLCDAECYYQRAAVYHFRATGLPLLSSKGTSSPADALTSRAELLRYATDGLAVIEQGISRLPRQARVGTGDATRDLAYSRYLKSLAQLSALKAKLLMAAGDVWYRDASVARLERVHYLVGEALGATPAADGDKGSEFYKAATYYDQAFWLLLEARSSVPDSDVFTAELSALATAEKDVTLRLDSVRKGYLYINVDPEQLPLRGIDELGMKLHDQRDALERHEQNLQNIMEAWARKYTDLQNQQFDLANLRNSRSIELEVHKIAQIQDMGEQLKNAVQQQLNDVTSDISRFELEQRIRVLEANLKRETNDLSNQIRVVKGQSEQDLLEIDQDATREDMGQIQFNIDMTLAAFNFQMQHDSLDIQAEELQNRIDADAHELGILESRRGQIRKQIQIEERSKEAAEILANRYRTAKETVFRSSRIPIVNQICSVDAELAFYTGSAQGFSDPVTGASCSSPPSIPAPNQELINDICEAREELRTKSKEEIDKIKACLNGTGSSCTGGEEHLKKAAEELYNQNVLIFEHQRTMWQATVDKIKNRESELQRVTGVFNGLEGMKAAAMAAAVAAEIAAAIPDGDTGVMGIFPVKTFRIAEAVADSLKIIADKLAQVYEWRFNDLQFETQLNQEIHELGVRRAELESEIAALDLHRAYEEWVKKRSLAEINVQLAGLDKEAAELVEEGKIQTLQCQQDEGQVASTIGKLRADRAALEAELQAKSDEAALVDFDIEERENARDQAQLEIERLTLSLGELDIEARKVDQDMRNLEKMKGLVERQQSRIGEYWTRVSGLQSDYDAKRALLEDIREKIRQNVIDLSAEQAAFLETVIRDETAATFAQIEDLREQINLVEQARRLEGEVLTLEKEMRDAVLASRERILDLIEAAPEHNPEKLFWDFEDMAADLTKGAVEFLDAKRRVVENVNFTYNMYRNRYNMLTDFAGDVAPLSSDKTFIGTAADLDALLGDCGSVGMSEICRPSSLVWTSQTMTGSVAEFSLLRTSGLVTELLENGRARFEVSPAAASLAGSQNLGNFTLWDERTMNASQPMRLVHVVAGVTTSGGGTSCRFQNIEVSHLGSGVVFSRLSKDSPEIVPSLVVKPPASAILPAYSGSERESIMSREYERFRDGTYTAKDMETRLQSQLTASAYPFVGYPVVGTYELTADENMLNCLKRDAASLELGFIFVRKPAR